MSNYAKSDLIDQDYARENFRKEPHCFKLPVEGFYLHENISGIGHGTWTVFFVEADGDETDICRVITVGELNNVLRLLKANLAAVSAIEEIRDEGVAITEKRADAKITELIRDVKDGDCSLSAIFDDGSTRKLFNFFIDELAFFDADLIGKTEAEAHQLHSARTIAYIQS